MAIKIRTDLDFGQKFYLRGDDDQLEYQLVGITIMPGNILKFILSRMGDMIEVYDFEASIEKDLTKILDIDAKDDDE